MKKTNDNQRNGGKTVIIAGAGIAGLSAALALSHQGFSVRLFERAPILSEQGAGIQLSPNATVLLRQWGLEQTLLSYASQPDSIELHDGMRGNHLVSLPVARFAHNYWGAPYVTIHRGDLQKILSEAIAQHPLVELQCGCEVIDASGHLNTGFNVTVKNKAGIVKNIFVQKLALLICYSSTPSNRA